MSIISSRVLQDRVTDHRVPISTTGLENIMQGGVNLDLLTAALQEKWDEESLDALTEQ